MTSKDQFAVRELQKHGWDSGKGLGRLENGMKDAIKVKLKNNKGGVGHDPGSDFTFHWWDHIFNKAANSIKVTSSGDEIKIEKDKNAKKLQPVLTYNKKISSKFSGQSLLYGTFVKSGTFVAGEEEENVEVSSDSDDSDTDSEEYSAKDTLEKTYKLTGLTGHKAARHGHKLGGKLQRIQDQEHSQQKCNKKNPEETENVVKDKIKKKRKRETISSEEKHANNKNNKSIKLNEKEDTEECGDIHRLKKKKKKKKKNTADQ